MSMSYELPQELSAHHGLGEAGEKAYTTILSHEQWAVSTTARKTRERRLICARVLGQLVLEGPSSRAVDRVIQDVNSCQDDHARLHAIGAMYLDHFVRLCEYYRSFILSSHADDLLAQIVKKNKGKSPKPFRHSWRNLFEAEKLRMKEKVAETGKPSDHYEKTKQLVSIDFLITLLFYLAIFKALRRDNHQCIFTGGYDDNSYLKIPEVKQEVNNSNMVVLTTECAHIFPQSTNSISDENKVWIANCYLFLWPLTMLCSVSTLQRCGLSSSPLDMRTSLRRYLGMAFIWLITC